MLATLSEAFEDNEDPAAPVGIDGAELSLVVLIPGEDAVPERLPAKTQAGNLTLRQLPKGEWHSFYRLLVAGHMLSTLREAFAVAPGITSTACWPAAGPGRPSTVSTGRTRRRQDPHRDRHRTHR